MRALRTLYHLARADFLERVRRYGFLVTLAATVYLGYAAYSGQIIMRLDEYQGDFNSAWSGAMMTFVTTTFLSFFGFYVIKNAVARDAETRVGEILASTPMSRLLYVLGKALSNFLVLALMVAVMLAGAIVMALTKGGGAPFEPAQILLPFALLALPAMAFTAALAVFFEVVGFLSGGFGNAIYFTLWSALLGFLIANGHDDPLGGNMLVQSMGRALRQIDPGYRGGFGLTIGNVKPTQTYHWNGIEWTSAMVSARLAWFGVAAAFVAAAALFFDRFDPARRRHVLEREEVEDEETADGEMPDNVTPMAPPRLETLAGAAPRSRFADLLWAELRLMRKSISPWWLYGLAALIVASLLTPLDASDGPILMAAWVWPLLLWSPMGNREIAAGTWQITFSAAQPVRRQLPAVWAAGALVTAVAGAGVLARLLVAGDPARLLGWIAGALFIPSLALALGVWSGGRRMFEAVYFTLWYVGALNQTPQLDYMGITREGREAGVPLVFLALAGALVVAAVLGRARQVRR